jgi:hypothetical protein
MELPVRSNKSYVDDSAEKGAHLCRKRTEVSVGIRLIIVFSRGAWNGDLALLT